MPETINTQSENRDQQILRRLANIEHKIDSFEQTTAFTLRAEADKHNDSLRAIFKKSTRRAQIYLASNGSRSVQEIANLLVMKQPNVSADIKILHEEGLLEVSDIVGGESYWNKKPIDRTIRISTFLQKEFNLTKDGLPNEKS